MSRVYFELTDNNVIQCNIESQGLKKEKFFTFNELCDLILSCKHDTSEFKKITTVAEYFTPEDTIFKVKTVYHKILSNNMHTVFLLKEACQIPFILQMREIDKQLKFENVGIPPLLFRISYFKNHAKDIRVFAVKTNDIELDTPIFGYPFSNVNFKSGNICFGNNQISNLEFPSIYDTRILPSIFLNIPNNMDSYNSNRTFLDIDYIPLLELCENYPFDLEILKPIDRTFQQLID